MLPALLGLQVLTAIVVLVLLLRRPAPTQTAADPRLQTLLAADLPLQLARGEARAEALERLLRSELGQLRQEAAVAAERTRTGLDLQNTSLRRELLEGIHTLSDTLGMGLESFREGHTQEAERLRVTVEGRLDKLNEVNAQRLDAMRATVDEKLQSTLQTRLTESFGAVADQLTKVHTGLGEMSKLSAGVDDLSRIFTNVKSRGGFAEVQLGMLLSQMLAPNQFSQNVKVKPNTAEMVEYAVKLPTPHGDLLLPIDAKFPREAWERLETAYGEGAAGDIASAGKAFEAAIRTEGKRICEKYIAPPVTTRFAVMFLPTEGLYAEVMRRDGLQADIQQNCRVTIAGPSTLSAILNSFQMGFHMLELQQKGDEVWKVLASAKGEFEKFETLMGTMERQVGTVQNTIEKLNTRTRGINKALREVSTEDASARISSGAMETGLDNLLPMLAASESG